MNALTQAAPTTLSVHDLRPPAADFRADLLAGLRRSPKEIPSKYFYDAAGSALFEAITRLEAYYPTRTEIGILRRTAGAIAARLGPNLRLVEMGSGSSVKTRILLDRLEAPAGYMPVDISREHLIAAAGGLAAAYPDLPIQALVADYTAPFRLPPPPRPPARTVVFYPGSTIGNFHPPEAERFLRRMRAIAGEGGGLLIGVDLKKDPAILERAYDDPEGVTAAFNRNVLARANRELGSDFDPQAFAHRAPYHPDLGRVEMHLVSRCAQLAHLGDTTIPFAAGEPIVTEHCYKYDLAGFEALAGRAGWVLEEVWTDPQGWFSVQLFAAGP